VQQRVDVDDILIASEEEGYISIMYDMTDIGQLDNFLNAKITKTCEKISINQTHYYLEVLNTFDFLVQGRIANQNKCIMQASH
jgi:hypothetical protein